MIEQEIRTWIGNQIRQIVGPKVLRVILVGSRAKGTARKESDWDVIVLVDGARSIWPVGPVRKDTKLTAPDGNVVEFFRLAPDDLDHDLAQTCRLTEEGKRFGIDI